MFNGLKKGIGLCGILRKEINCNKNLLQDLDLAWKKKNL